MFFMTQIDLLYNFTASPVEPRGSVVVEMDLVAHCMYLAVEQMVAGWLENFLVYRARPAGMWRAGTNLLVGTYFGAALDKDLFGPLDMELAIVDMGAFGIGLWATELNRLPCYFLDKL